MMLNSYCRLFVPEDLAAYYKVTDTIKRVKSCYQTFDTNIVINRDAKGCIISVSYFSAKDVQTKQVYYKEDEIYKIDYYGAGCLTSTEIYKAGLLVSEIAFDNNGAENYSLDYQYNNKSQRISIYKKFQNKEIKIVYKYDEFGRITTRTISLNKEVLLEQNYKYDILDRIIGYTDNNQSIVVNRISKKNELLYYVITDKMYNNITIVNHLTPESNYDYTEITVNGHSSIVRDISYVDNVMLKRPCANEEDLDLIISNLFREDDIKKEEIQNKRTNLSTGVISSNIEWRALPISMRKRLLYSLSSKA